MKSVLVVDDNPVMVSTLSDIFELEGWDVHQAYDGAEAIEQARRQASVGAVLMDIRMPGINGVRALEVIKEERPELPVIIMTAFAVTDLVDRAVEAGSLELHAHSADPSALVQRLACEPSGVMLFDDDAGYLVGLSEGLTRRGRSHRLAGDLPSAVEAFESGTSDVLLVAASLPRTSPDTVYIVRELSAPVAVILETPLGPGGASSVPALRSRVFGVVRKPCPPQTLVSLLREAIDA